MPVSPSYSEGRGKEDHLNPGIRGAVSYDCATALDPRQQSKTLFLLKKILKIVFIYISYLKTYFKTILLVYSRVSQFLY